MTPILAILMVLCFSVAALWTLVERLTEALVSIHLMLRGPAGARSRELSELFGPMATSAARRLVRKGLVVRRELRFPDVPAETIHARGGRPVVAYRWRLTREETLQ